jgi:hypothetical protein
MPENINNPTEKINYSIEDIMLLSEALKHNKEAYELLHKTDREELAQFCDAFVYDEQTALEWLVDNKYKELYALYYAIENDDFDMDQVLEGESPEWTATARATKQDREAQRWLLDNNFKHFAYLAKTIIDIAED